ncbi:alpha/beta fold hydrolase [Polymorphobacter arshaanensis]|uniref:Alpha/beta fold hydrolase n=1 Tax=Glacieibacterium arshaanense TaxID=2511025 RepID=A0A4Y9EM37_9SPHN|nr:alpha/beta fold hydrolase BchO [Polymorphobacter arshaanensis]TFU03125.1 alpha/beta fold hydrolase [Polymorphobacter arshaanensis]
MTAPRWSVEGKGWPNSAHSRFVESGRLRWHVQVMGAGPALLLLHGTGAATHSWRALAPLLAEHFTVVAVDLPGHGFTSWRPADGMSMPAMARTVGNLLRRLEIAPDAIVGHSAGAAIACRMVLDGQATPDAIIGLSAALLPFPGLGAKLFPSLARLLFVNPLAPHFLARLARTRGETAQFLLRSTGSRIDDAGVAFYQRLFATSGHCAGAITMMANWDLDALARDLPLLQTRMLLVHGSADAAIPISSARSAAALVGDGRLTALVGLGHLAHEEKPEVVVEAIREFVGGRG